MSNLVRTTISVPEDIYQQARITAAALKISLSGLITRILEEKISGQKVQVSSAQAKKIIGSLDLGIGKIYQKRSDLYAKNPRAKVGH